MPICWPVDLCILASTSEVHYDGSTTESDGKKNKHKEPLSMNGEYIIDTENEVSCMVNV